MNSPDSDFSYSRDNGKDSRIFPIDYTLQEFSELIKSGRFPFRIRKLKKQDGSDKQNRSDTRDGSDWRTIRNRLLHHPLLKPILEDMLYSDIKHSQQLASEERIPIPLEAAPLLACIHQLGFFRRLIAWSRYLLR